MIKYILSQMNEFFSKPLNMQSRIIIVIAAFILLPTFFFPMWHMSFWAQQYPDGLDLYIYSHRLDSGDDGNDLREINILNHYIGMKELIEDDFTEFKWIPLAIVMFIFVSLRAAVFGSMDKLVDAFFLFVFFGMYSIWSFWYRLYSYGHNLNPKAAVHVDPFTPPVLGFKPVGQFKVWSYPDISSYLFMIFVLLLVVAAWLSRNETSHRDFQFPEHTAEK